MSGLSNYVVIENGVFYHCKGLVLVSERLKVDKRTIKSHIEQKGAYVKFGIEVHLSREIAPKPRGRNASPDVKKMSSAARAKRLPELQAESQAWETAEMEKMKAGSRKFLKAEKMKEIGAVVKDLQEHFKLNLYAPISQEFNQDKV